MHLLCVDVSVAFLCIKNAFQNDNNVDPTIHLDLMIVKRFY